LQKLCSNEKGSSFFLTHSVVCPWDMRYAGMFVRYLTGFVLLLGEKIEHMLRCWYGDYELLEDNHNYIQWYIFFGFDMDIISSYLTYKFRLFLFFLELLTIKCLA